ncbi:MAG: acetyl-CoA acetyltransferase [Dehalococcoidia bacterium]
MTRKVAIVGLGQTSFRLESPDASYKELIFEAAVKAYEETGIDPRKDVDSFVSVAEDLTEGTSIFDEYTPDQVGAVLSPMHTICGDGIHGLISAYMQILTGALDIVVVEAHSKASNILTPSYITAFAMDPVHNRPLEAHPLFIAGMEMNRFLQERGATREQCARVTVKNRRNALDNPAAAHPASISVEDVMNSEPLFYPLSRLDVSASADGALVMVVAAEERVRSLTDSPIWIKGVGWCTDTPSLETRDWSSAVHTQIAAGMAYKMADMQDPRSQIDLVEVDDSFSFKELQHLEALKLCGEGEAGLLTEEGATERGGALPVNVSGGSLGVGHLGEATGLQKVAELILQLRGQAGKRQVANVETALAQSWRGVPTSSSAVIILSKSSNGGHA